MNDNTKIRTQLMSLLIMLLIMALPLNAGETRYDDLPKGVYTALVGAGFFDHYEVYFEMSPFFQRGDFNGDGAFDIAIQVVHKTSRKRGIVFLHQNDLNYYIIGAGKSFADLGDDFSWLNKWRIDSFNKQGAGEGLILDNPSFPKSLVYFDGKSYQAQGMDAYSYYSDGPAFSQILPQL